MIASLVLAGLVCAGGIGTGAVSHRSMAPRAKHRSNNDCVFIMTVSRLSRRNSNPQNWKCAQESFSSQAPQSRYPDVLSVLPSKVLLLLSLGTFLASVAPLVLHTQCSLSWRLCQDGSGLLGNKLKTLAGGLFLQRLKIASSLGLIGRLQFDLSKCQSGFVELFSKSERASCADDVL